MIDVQYQLHDCYSTMRPQGQNVVQREVVRTVYISVYSIQETSSLIVQHIVDEAKPYHSTHTLFSFIVVPSRRDGLYTFIAINHLNSYIMTLSYLFLPSIS